MEFQYWILYYAIPAGIVTYIKSRQSSAKNRLVTLHAFMLLSILLLSTVDISLRWNFQILSLLGVGGGILLSIYFLGSMGLLYAVSSVMQEYCLLLAASLIVPASSLLLGAALTALPYTLTHFAPHDRILQSWKNPIVFLWGIISILLYFWFQQPLLNITVHIIGGAFLINRGVLYEHGFQKIK